jgi:DNA-binding NarL/FixJ family response regulator
MVAQRSSARFVPFSFLAGASCLLPEATLARAHAEPARSSFVAPATADGRSLAADLTAAEQRVCELLLRGLSNKEIASELGRAEPTIKNQVAAVLRKHGVPSRARLIALLR